MRTGRRPGDSGTRAAILEAARRRFWSEGYDGATIRAMARDARVDPALVHHYFGSKEELFAAAMEIPVDPGKLVEAVLDGPRGELGTRLVRTFLSVWDSAPGDHPFRSLVRSALANEHAASMLREFVTSTVLQRLAEKLRVPDARLRASLVGSQLVGLGMIRYVLEVEPLASARADELVDLVGPTVQRYLTGKL